MNEGGFVNRFKQMVGAAEAPATAGDAQAPAPRREAVAPRSEVPAPKQVAPTKEQRVAAPAIQEALQKAIKPASDLVARLEKAYKVKSKENITDTDLSVVFAYQQALADASFNPVVEAKLNKNHFNLLGTLMIYLVANEAPLVNSDREKTFTIEEITTFSKSATKLGEAIAKDGAEGIASPEMVKTLTDLQEALVKADKGLKSEPVYGELAKQVAHLSILITDLGVRMERSK